MSEYLMKLAAEMHDKADTCLFNAGTTEDGGYLLASACTPSGQKCTMLLEVDQGTKMAESLGPDGWIPAWYQFVKSDNYAFATLWDTLVYIWKRHGGRHD